MEKLKPRTLSGFMELLPAPQQKFERMLEILRKNFCPLRLHAHRHAHHRVGRNPAGQGRR